MSKIMMLEESRSPSSCKRFDALISQISREWRCCCLLHPCVLGCNWSLNSPTHQHPTLYPTFLRSGNILPLAMLYECQVQPEQIPDHFLVNCVNQRHGCIQEMSRKECPWALLLKIPHYKWAKNPLHDARKTAKMDEAGRTVDSRYP